jgi:predicted oxidoreductase
MSAREGNGASGFLIQGCMGLGGDHARDAWTPADVDRAAEVIHAALEAGMTAFDHADIYCRGKAEAVFGEALAEERDLRDRIFIQTKCGIRPKGSAVWAAWKAPAARTSSARDPGRYDLSEEWILATARASLARLRCDWIDRLLLHRPDPLLRPDEIARAFRRLKDDGVVRAFGVSNCSAAQMAWIQRACHREGIAIEVNQIELSLLHHDVVEAGITVNQRAWAGEPWKGEFDSTAGSAMAAASSGAADMLPWCAMNGVDIQAWGPLAQGRLTGRPLSPDAPPAVLRTAALVREIAREHGTAPEAVVIAWLLRLPVPVRPIIGTRDPKRISDCAKGIGLSLSREDWYALYESARGGEMP